MSTARCRAAEAIELSRALDGGCSVGNWFRKRAYDLSDLSSTTTRELSEAAEHYIRQQPTRAIAAAVALGGVAGFLFGRR